MYTKFSEPNGWPLVLGKIDGMVQTYLRALSKQGGVINTVVANATARVLISRNPNAVANVDVKSSRWAKSLFTRMNFAIKKRNPRKNAERN